jgi:hypothetical protein
MSAERILTEDILLRIADGVIRPVVFVFADFPDSPMRVWTGEGPLEWDGHTWLGIGEVLGIEIANETVDLAARGISITVSGVDSAFVQQLFLTSYQGRSLNIYLGFYDETESNLSVTPGVFWGGYLDTDDIEDNGETATIKISAEHQLVDMLRKREIRMNHQSQITLHPGVTDTGFSRVEQIQDKKLPWGRNNV